MQSEMSFTMKVMRSALSKSHKLVVIAIYEVNNQGIGAPRFFSQVDIANMIGATRQYMPEALRDIEASGWLQFIAQDKQTGMKKYATRVPANYQPAVELNTLSESPDGYFRPVDNSTAESYKKVMGVSAQPTGGVRSD